MFYRKFLIRFTAFPVLGWRHFLPLPPSPAAGPYGHIFAHFRSPLFKVGNGEGKGKLGGGEVEGGGQQRLFSFIWRSRLTWDAETAKRMGVIARADTCVSLSLLIAPVLTFLEAFAEK